MKRYNLIKIAFIIMAFIPFACTNSSTSDEGTGNKSKHLIQITQQQFETNAMKMGELSTQIFEDKVRCNGYIIAPANGMAMVSTQIAGIVESINYCPGEYVKKGQTLCTLSSPDLIVLQQDFAETSARLKQLKTDYDRSKTLFSEKIGAEKDLINKESDYKAMAAKHHSLKLQLELLKLNVSKIEAGELYATFPIKAPINGYITKQEIMLGQFIEQQKQLIEIVDVNQLQLELSVFEKDIQKLKIGQNVWFNLLGEVKSAHQAQLMFIGKSINMESKTIECMAQIKNEDKSNFINRSFVEANIIVYQREAKALPNEALLKSGNNYYVFVVEKKAEQTYFLRKVKVNIGSTSKGFIEIMDGGVLKNVVTNGVYNLQTE